jgi:transcriptional regulator with XRE-family HTH domain
MTQGERVHEIRKSLNLTLEKFGEKLGVGKTAIFKIEKSENSLTDQMVRSICREYNVSYDYLINGEGEIFDDLPQTVLDELCTQYDLSDFDRMLVAMYVELPKELREQAENCIKKFLEKKNKKSEDV